MCTYQLESLLPRLLHSNAPETFDSSIVRIYTQTLSTQLSYNLKKKCICRRRLLFVEVRRTLVKNIFFEVQPELKPINIVSIQFVIFPIILIKNEDQFRKRNKYRDVYKSTGVGTNVVFERAPR